MVQMEATPILVMISIYYDTNFHQNAIIVEFLVIFEKMNAVPRSYAKDRGCNIIYIRAKSMNHCAQ